MQFKSIGCEQLWTDERICTWAANRTDNAWEYRRLVEGMKRVRDDYEKHIEELEDEQKNTWPDAKSQ
jgi:hypothetical protein